MDAIEKIIKLTDCFKKLEEIDPDLTHTAINKAKTKLGEKILEVTQNLEIDLKNENDLPAGVKVLWKNKVYITGNRRQDEVELYRDGKLVRVVRIPSVKVVEK